MNADQDFDPEEFCDVCFAGLLSSEHHAKCVIPERLAAESGGAPAGNPLHGIAHDRDADRTIPTSDERLTRYAEAIAAVTPCSCSAQRSRAEAAEAKVAELRRIIMQGGQDAASVRHEAVAALAGPAELEPTDATVYASVPHEREIHKEDA